MSNQPQGGTAQPTDSHRGLRLLGLVAVSAGVLLLMAAAFVLSYTGIHAVALSAGVSPRFARIYPGIFDAMLLVAFAAVLSLRGAGLLSRCYAWLTMLVLLAAAAGADTLHAMNTQLPHKPAAAVAAIIPWALVLLGFGLLLSMLRNARLRRATLAAAPERAFMQPSGHVEVRQRHGLDDLFGSKSPPDVPAVRYVPPANALTLADAAPDLAIESDPGHDDPSSDEGHPAGRTGERQDQPSGYRGNSGSAFSPAPTVDLASDAGAPVARGPGRRGEAGTVPEPRRAAAPAPRTKPATNAKPASDARPAANAKTTANARPAANAKTTANAGPETEAEPVPEAAAEPVSEAEPVPEPSAEAEPVPEPSAEAEPVPEPEPGSDPEAAADAEPVPAAPLQFNRVRSSPVPPEA
jgi:Protein of unknown function (DUF2637)